MAKELWEKFRFRGKDLRGTRFGRLTVIALAANHISRSGQVVRYWTCRCSCERGTEKDISVGALCSGQTLSCGCWQRERMGKLNLSHGMAIKGVKKHPIYMAWGNMLSRCNNPNHESWGQYGGRGLRVDERWYQFENFRDDMLPTWRAGLQIERKNNELGYSKENCVWATRIEQSNNRRTNHMIEINGVKKSIADWARIYGINPLTIASRINIMGWDGAEAVLTPVSPRRGTPRGFRQPQMAPTARGSTSD